MSSSPLTPAVGRFHTSAQAFTVDRPTRKPEKEPGPASTANKSICSKEIHARSSSSLVSLRRLAEYRSSDELTRCPRIVRSRSTAVLPVGELLSSAKTNIVEILSLTYRAAKLALLWGHCASNLS